MISAILNFLHFSGHSFKFYESVKSLCGSDILMSKPFFHGFEGIALCEAVGGKCFADVVKVGVVNAAGAEYFAECFGNGFRADDFEKEIAGCGALSAEFMIPETGLTKNGADLIRV